MSHKHTSNLFTAKTPTRKPQTRRPIKTTGIRPYIKDNLRCHQKQYLCFFLLPDHRILTNHKINAVGLYPR